MHAERVFWCVVLQISDWRTGQYESTEDGMLTISAWPESIARPKVSDCLMFKVDLQDVFSKCWLLLDCIGVLGYSGDSICLLAYACMSQQDDLHFWHKSWVASFIDWLGRQAAYSGQHVQHAVWHHVAYALATCNAYALATCL